MYLLLDLSDLEDYEKKESAKKLGKVDEIIGWKKNCNDIEIGNIEEEMEKETTGQKQKKCFDIEEKNRHIWEERRKKKRCYLWRKLI